jgi:hypothetical protein
MTKENVKSDRQDGVQAVGLKTARQDLKAYMEGNTPVMLWGAPGVGKSDTVKQVGRDWQPQAQESDEPVKGRKENIKAKALPIRGIPVITLIASLRDAVDLRGIPDLDRDEKVARWLPPNDLPRADRDGPEGILFLDEINTAPQSVQAACFGLVLDRKLGDYHLPKGWRIVAAGNKQSHRAAAQRMPTALANRFAHIEIEPNIEDFTEYLVRRDVQPEFISFIRYRKDLLHVMPVNQEQHAFPTPRSWVDCTKYLEHNPAQRHRLVGGRVGTTAAMELEAFLRIYAELPSVEEMLKNPEKCRVPLNPAGMYAATSALAAAITTKNFKEAITYAKRMSREFEVMMVIDAIRRDSNNSACKAATDWSYENQNVIY